MPVTVREIQPSEIETVIEVLTRAFATDACYNYWGNVKPSSAITDLSNLTPASKRTYKGLRAYHNTIVRSSVAVGALILVAVDDDTKEIKGAAIWNGPGVGTTDFPVGVLLKNGVFKTLNTWGVGALKKIFVEFTPAAEKVHKRVFKEKGLDPENSWHLVAVGVDPSAQGQGIGPRLTIPDVVMAKGKPLHLESTSKRSRDLYIRLGYELHEELVFGKGKINANGIAAKGPEATGYSHWVLTKWDVPKNQ
ncbi:hypothetical protein CYLTODRAFT_493392 [Cylindrobasidium torrendii FP15055 ss-10]|uniref:N-acetyltransferase domain-containing protein n=1 Tax=Cylindrobasidium torrendii FP15055 ss-10 TaxID=1314674 RepID=A0A0D7B1P8_9AGAR|nr:hypothetical protein CYLTODRAFT_493392 [Cylindrobasidium torrendii FP15055 ss-10]